MLPKNLKFVFSVMQLLVLMVWVSHALADQVQLAWDAPTNPDGTPVTTLAGYRLYYWQGSLEVTQSVDVGNQTTYTLTGLVDGATYSFVATAYDTSGNESGDSNTVTVTVASTPGAPVTIAVLANDSDPDGNPLTIAAVTQGAHGTVTISGTTVTYTPAAIFAGIDSFTYTITDGQGGSVTATITVTVSVIVQLEAEAGTLYSPMAVGTDTTTPTLQYVWVPDSNGNILDPLQNGGYVRYSFAVPKADGYVIWGRVSPSETGTGSFFIGVDVHGPAPYLVWDVTPMPTSRTPPPPWAWDEAASDTTPVFFLVAGNHTLTIRQRESGSKLDKLVITNNLNLIPHD